MPNTMPHPHSSCEQCPKSVEWVTVNQPVCNADKFSMPSTNSNQGSCDAIFTDIHSGTLSIPPPGQVNLARAAAGNMR